MTEQTSSQLAVRPAQDDPEIQRFARLGSWLAAAEAKNPTPQEQGAAAALRMYMAKELGLPIWAASQLSMVRGRLVVGVELLRALARREGYSVTPLELDDDHCTAVVVDTDTGQEIGRATFTIEDAKRAGIHREGSGWTTYPQRMLWARAAGWAVRDAIPEVAMGLIVKEEAAEIDADFAYEPAEGSIDSPEPEPVPT